jgi:hypothetical protein
VLFIYLKKPDEEGELCVYIFVVYINNKGKEKLKWYLIDWTLRKKCLVYRYLLILLRNIEIFIESIKCKIYMILWR